MLAGWPRAPLSATAVTGTLFRCYRVYSCMNWDSEKEMARDVEENKELYEALADDVDESDT